MARRGTIARKVEIYLSTLPDDGIVTIQRIAKAAYGEQTFKENTIRNILYDMACKDELEVVSCWSSDGNTAYRRIK